MFAWRGEIGGRVVEGADFVRADARGKITEIRVFIRPLVDIGVFAGAAGPPLARRRGRLQALVLRALTLPLRALLAAVDAVAPRLAQRRRQANGSTRPVSSRLSAHRPRCAP